MREAYFIDLIQQIAFDLELNRINKAIILFLVLVARRDHNNRRKEEKKKRRRNNKKKKELKALNKNQSLAILAFGLKSLLFKRSLYFPVWCGRHSFSAALG